MGGDVEYRGQLSAWLQKRKSGASAFRIREYNKRYFTLDFDTHTFFYAHSEGSSKVSAVTPFADIVDVRMPEADLKGDNISEFSKSSRRSFLQRTTSFLKATKEAEEQHMLMVMTRPAKTMELMCASATEALTWFEALKTAIAMDREQATEAGHTTASASESEEKPPPAPPLRGGYPTPTPVPAGRGVPEAPIVSPAREEMEAGDISPPPARGTFLDLSVEAPSELVATPQRGDPVADGTTVVEAAGPVVLQAADFGFAEEEDSASASSGASTPRDTGAVVAADAPSPAAHGGRRPSGTYGDRHEGMSMKERLDSLEFSDEEEDDDDPLGLKK
ncbi:U2AF35B [Symbiodinium natans]|uniref:U2AF35B protein n=1 Tax=Symbiodinium natans TaxID=878477 RepID=A0A812QQW0_9DINO|nr:U2AF35B [Symbiodinium natans]